MQTSVPLKKRINLFTRIVYTYICVLFQCSSGTSGLIVAMLKWQKIVIRVRKSLETGAKTEAKTESQNAATTT